ncbi:putative Inhibitor of dGTPase [Erwinia phage pEa_SNUABM_57]|uniref:Inhibitor of dGTPase n=1 Tax=Erwinia phage pEa_SNUABM_57 TaxID=2996118 RepID=A0A9E8YU74_9CAUD|nr:putative Inhibitor of dGTPase [Erwinia phage pEa_SNUABM_57]
MGRLYSGNLNDYKDAIARLKEDHDVEVERETYHYRDIQHMRTVCGEALRVVTRSGCVLAGKAFEESDEDVRCNSQTAWLRKIHSDLKHWK